jgi:DNA replicative helicase MCM subunit Mcm2 (Cdc46/Mcm family)
MKSWHSIDWKYVYGLCDWFSKRLKKMNFCKKLLCRLTKIDGDSLFEDIVGYDHIKRLFGLALESDSTTHTLLVGPPASAKTMFLTSLVHRLKNSYFTDGGNSSKAGVLDYLLTNKPRYLLVDEIDRMSTKDQAFLLNLNRNS